MKIPYGYIQSTTGEININQKQSSVVKSIYDLYLQSKSLGGIVDTLQEKNIPSPTGNPRWTRAAIDKILSNGRYVSSIISENQFWKAQIERERRTNIDDNGRKTARYNSQNVLSGLLVCGECGCTYRRITRPSGEVVWRCADKVESGKQAKCSNTMTVSDEEIKRMVCGQLGVEDFDEEAVRDEIGTIVVGEGGITVQMKTPQSPGLMVL
ncbi:MAG: recombinase family protein [Christensenellaceae bacterium]|jgi:hypothetical protein|nr:recombinase family protein [Christensenellaceae bacterium]